MKKLLAVFLIFTSLLTLISCGADLNCTTEGAVSTTTQSAVLETTVGDSCTTTAPPPVFTSNDPSLPAIILNVKIIAGGIGYEPYSEMIYFTDGSVIGDGYLMFVSVPTRLKEIAAQIPSIPLDEETEIAVISGEEFNGMVDVYGEDYELLAEDMTLSEVYEKGTWIWQNTTVYLYFEVSEHAEYAGSYEKGLCNAYFFKTTFPKMTQTPAIGQEVTLVADGKTYVPYEEMIWITDYMWDDGQGSIINGDGHLMFVSVTSRLPEIAEKIPSVTLTENAKIVSTAREGVKISGSGNISVYGADYELLAENMTLEEIFEKGKGEWLWQTVYLYFNFSFSMPLFDDAKKELGNGYFVKTSFTPTENYPVPHEGII